MSTQGVALLVPIASFTFRQGRRNRRRPAVAVGVSAADSSSGKESGTGSDEAKTGNDGPASIPKRAPGGGGRVARRAGGAAGPRKPGASPSAVKRTVRRRTPTGSAADRGKARTEEEKALAMKQIKAAAVAPRIAQLSESLAAACGRDEYKDAQASYAELKSLMKDGELPSAVFEDMLELYARLQMPSSAEGVFMDMMGAGHAPTEDVCWKLLEVFEKAGEKTRAEKVLAYMEARGMS